MIGDIANTVEDATDGKSQRDVSESDAKKMVEPEVESTLRSPDADKVKKSLAPDETLPTEGPAGRAASQSSNHPTDARSGAGSPTPTKVDDSAEQTKEKEPKASKGPTRRSGKNTHPWE